MCCISNNSHMTILNNNRYTKKQLSEMATVAGFPSSNQCDEISKPFSVKCIFVLHRISEIHYE